MVPTAEPQIHLRIVHYYITSLHICILNINIICHLIQRIIATKLNYAYAPPCKDRRWYMVLTDQRRSMLVTKVCLCIKRSVAARHFLVILSVVKSSEYQWT